MHRFRRVSWGLVDQALSSLSNSLLLITMARVGTPAEFGAFSLTFLGLTLCLSSGRGLVGARIVLLSDDMRALRAEAQYAFTFSVVGGLVLSLIAVPTAAALGFGVTTIILATLLPVVLAQDSLRFVAVAEGRAIEATASDALWVLAGIAGLALTTIPNISPVVPLGLWALGSVAALAHLLVRLKIRPALRGVHSWLKIHLVYRLTLGGEGLISPANTFIVSSMVGASLSLVSVAALRGAGTLIGPISLLMGSLPMLLVPEIRRSGPTRTGRSLVFPLIRVSLMISVLSLIVGLAPYWVPAPVGRAVLGETWDVAIIVLPIMGIEYVGQAFMHSAAAGLRALERPRGLLVVRVCYAVTTLTLVALVLTRGDVRLIAGCSAVTAVFFGTIMMVLLAKSKTSTSLPSGSTGHPA